MNKVQDQYEAYPYPARDPRDEAQRLITGSPSHPLELDHFLFAGKRDWSKPLRILSAGGGTGDGLIQLTTLLQAAGRPYQATYVDLSTAAREIAEARAAVRKLDNITFVTGSLLDAPSLGQFDYIDCCGVLHHLPEPQAGFDALSAALAPDGGMGLMVYAPYGRSGVYPLQQGFAALWPDDTPSDRLRAAKEVMSALPNGHPFKCNPHLVDHLQSDAGFYDLLLHSQDRSYSVTELDQTLQAAGLRLINFTQPALYDLARLVPGPQAEGLSQVDRWSIAEKLRGTIKTHVAYVTLANGPATQARPSDRSLVPHLKGVPASKLAARVTQAGSVPITLGADKVVEPLDRAAAPLIAAIDGRRSLASIAQATGVDPIRFGALWAKIDHALGDWGLLLYARPMVERK
ncbi:methyltransferase [Actibacterium mucosum KCTC 23349]|uniref:Methyltransferase n=1 Tax=Actibacterium mucosum KCTC 23349 TaxID=1454373 RepID=A0A037ZEL8_9RHOB|nr:class I SAM-dependent methyltransferase [Actibacterium mucosum]KAJ54587.1 methyltransferase [Actibacterium mucosum KCTC 23349]